MYPIHNSKIRNELKNVYAITSPFQGFTAIKKPENSIPEFNLESCDGNSAVKTHKGKYQAFVIGVIFFLKKMKDLWRC